jgi:hypothetical protein
VYTPCGSTRPTPAAPVADRETTTSTVDDRAPAVRDAQADVVEALARAYDPTWWKWYDVHGDIENIAGDRVAYNERLQRARAAYAAAEEAWTRQVVGWLRSGGHLGKQSVLKPVLANAANALERREHLKENG